MVLSLPRAPAVLLRSGTLLALGSASQWRESESLSLSVSGVNLGRGVNPSFKLVQRLGPTSRGVGPAALHTRPVVSSVPSGRGVNPSFKLVQRSGPTWPGPTSRGVGPAELPVVGPVPGRGPTMVFDGDPGQYYSVLWFGPDHGF